MTHYADGHNKEPRSFFGGKQGGSGMPDIHSHHKSRKKKIAGAEHRHHGKRMGMKVHGKAK